MGDKVISTVGRRKTSIARVRITRGKGNILINKRELSDYFKRPVHQIMVKTPLNVTDSLMDFDIFVNVKGGGHSGQAGAVRHGLARALIIADPANRSSLKKNGFLTRDSRMVERKKYGHKGARKRFQFSKR
ncbi:MAG: 30S ribosomal protein S9 [bacterium]|nr:MAG: 30S ribosomal protein S9 [bacterium]